MIALIVVKYVISLLYMSIHHVGRRGMRQAYQTLFNMNHDLISGYRMRCNNHQELLARLKLVNVTIQRAARLRS